MKAVADRFMADGGDRLFMGANRNQQSFRLDNDARHADRERKSLNSTVFASRLSSCSRFMLLFVVVVVADEPS